MAATRAEPGAQALFAPHGLGPATYRSGEPHGTLGGGLLGLALENIAEQAHDPKDERRRDREPCGGLR
jgi:hypothetical protein